MRQPLLRGLLAVAVSAASIASASAYTPLQIEIRDVPLMEARDVIDRTLGSGSVDRARGEQLLAGTRTHVVGADKSWFEAHPDAKIYGGVPFYGLRNLPVAYEYFIQCGDTICGALYDVFP
jgi:hypothetical protein